LAVKDLSEPGAACKHFTKPTSNVNFVKVSLLKLECLANDLKTKQKSNLATQTRQTPVCWLGWLVNSQPAATPLRNTLTIQEKIL